MLRRIACSLWTGARGLWIGLALLAAALWPTRVAFVLIVAGAFMLVFHEQGQDLAIRLVETRAGWLAWTLFFCATAWWAVQSWLWSRLALDRRFGAITSQDARRTRTLSIRLFDGTKVESRALDWMVRGIPRLYALLVFLLAAYAILKAGGLNKFAGWLFVLAGVVLAVFLWWRRALLDPQRRPRIAAMATPMSGQVDSLFGVTPAGRFLTIGSLVVAAIMSAAVWWWPGAVGVGTVLGAPATTFIAFASILGVLGLASGASHLLHFPVIASLLIVGSAIAIVMPWPDHHQIPVADASTTGRRSLEHTWNQWQAANPAPDGLRPIVFVATAGGGVRAALWTTTVLDRVRQTDPKFDNRVFAVSGVSGGALGATAYLAGLSSGAAGSAGPCTPTKPEFGLCKLGDLGRTMFAADMLGPTFAAAFYGDLLLTFVPLPTPINSADALTESWRQAWAAAAPDKPRVFSQPFLSHWRDDAWRPVLMLNGTHVESGKRLITTDLQLASRGATVRDAWDLHEIVDGDIDTAMAALNAARFPGVVAAGTVVTRSGERWGHVIDGGYFENSGALGAVELADDVAQLAGLGARLRPVFIEIVSDPEINSRDSGRATSLAACNPSKGKNLERDKSIVSKPDDPSLCEAAEPIGFLIGLRGPLAGILNVRSGHGIWAPSHFAGQVTRLFRDRTGRAVEGEFVQFRLCPPREAARVPLGWQLSAASADDIVRSLPLAPPQEPKLDNDKSQWLTAEYRRWHCENENYKELQKLREVLNGK